MSTAPANTLWKKLVTFEPITGIHFQPDLLDKKPSGLITIRNMSAVDLLFKVKTNSPSNYLVKPNQGVFLPGQSA